jgi:WD40 repeat protein
MFFTGTGLLVERLDLLTNNLLPKLTGLTEMAPLNLALSPDDRLLAATDVGWIRVWDLDTGELIQTLRGSPLGPSAIYFNQAGSHLIATYPDGKLVMWDRSTWEEVSSVKIPGHQWRVLYILGQEALVLDHREGFVSIVDLEGQVLSTIDLQTRDYDFVSASPDGLQIIVHVGLGLRIFDITTGDEVQFLSLGELRLPAVTPDWRFLITFDTKKRLHIIDLESGETLLTQQMDFFKVRWLAVSPDGGLIGLFVIGPDQRTPYVELWGLVEEAESEP